MARVYLVDATNLLYRAYHALSGFTNSAGMPTNAVFGFVNMAQRLFKEEKPDLVAAVFDPPGPTRKHEKYAEYKANRVRPPDDLIIQIPYAKRALEVFGVPVLQVPGIEADDVIGTLAAQALARGDEVTIVTGDKDFCQLVTPSLTLLDTMRNIRIDPAGVVEKMGVPPEKVVDVLALAGDAVDNLPGAAGIGIKTAAKLVNEHGSLEEVVKAAPTLKGKKAEAIVEASERVLRNRELVTIEGDLLLPVSLDELKPRPLDREAAAELFRELNFKKLLADLDLNAVPEAAPKPQPARVHAASPPEMVEGWFAALYKDGAWVRSAPKGGLLFPPLAVGHSLKSQRELWREGGVEEDRIGLDTELAGYLLNPGLREYPVETLARDRGIDLGTPDPAGAYLNLAAHLRAEMRDAGVLKLNDEIEVPLISTLARMEKAGVLVDREKLSALSGEYEGRIKALEEKMFAVAGEEFNPRSTKELSRILFEKLQLPVQRKTATGVSTDAAVLEELSLSHELPALLLDHRSLTKLKNSFIDTLPLLIDPADGRIHTVYNQTVAATGRLSSTNPNLQNIPVRGEEGRRIREAFIAPPGKLLLSVDYSQIELRILAHLSLDRTLCETFCSGRDIHAETAARLFDVGPFAVTSDMRRQAKVVNFGILYGMSAFGLARRLGCDMKTATKMIETYFARFPTVKGFLGTLLDEARATGTARTMFGRIRRIKDLDSRNRNLREAAERLAINTPIQGAAADIMKLAMLKTERAIKEAGLNARMLLQVHDELVVEADEGDIEKTTEVVVAAMETAASLGAPLKAEAGRGRDWLSAHGG